MNTQHAHHNHAVSKLFAWSLALLLGAGTGQAAAADVNISDIPLDVLEGVPANIILTMDDSGSMAWGFLPDSNTSYWTKRYHAVNYNKLAYDPNITYLPGVDKNGASLGNANFTNAWYNAYNRVTGTMNLSTNYKATYYDYRPTANSKYYYGTGEPAFYYVFNTGTCDDTNAADINNDSCYTKVVVSSTSGPGATDERQNFANWFSYYRIRHLLAKTATSRAFAGLSTSVRVSWQELNRLKTIGDTLPFGGSHRDDFFTWLYGAPTNGGTPLTNAMNRAGGKIMNDSVYRKDPSDSSSPQYSCRQNFHFAFTDGYWNSNSVSLSPPNYDNQNNKTLPTTASSPYGDINYKRNTTLVADETPPIYRDGNSNFLADIAFYYWANDLNALPNNVPHYIADQSTDIDGDGDVDDFDIFWNPVNDPAEWQHMVNFTVGLGIDGVLANNTTTYQNLLNGTISWPTSATTGSNHHVDDLWHAAINSRGGYFSASNPDQLLTSFQNVLDAIDARTGSSSAVATTSSQYQAGTNLFQAIYDPGDWSGDILAKDVISLNTVWNAASVIAAQIAGTGRKIISFDPTSGSSGAGVAFQWSDLNTSQQLALNTLGGTNDGLGSARLDYLRGDKSNEQTNGGAFRNRTSPLGDIVHSDPLFVPPPGPPVFDYPDTLESAAYSSFVSTYSSRKNMLIFGGNDGMMHILDADTGNELLAYVPSPVYGRLSELSDPLYQHQFYVDQPVQVGDVFYNGSWHSIAIGGLGKGGQGIYALDITNPATFTEGNAANIARWEFTDADDADLGYTYTRPQIMKMNNGQWMVAFGNGYNSIAADGNASTTGDAALFLLDVEFGGKGTGTRVKISTETGTAEDPTGQGRANRLTDVVGLDKNRDFKVDILYAGDLFGNLWKFDVSDPDPANWDIIKQGTTPKPLFQARDDNGNAQPVTVTPQIQYHQKKHGYLLYLGTGQYLEADDPSDLGIQTLYAVWDREENSVNTILRSHLLEQEILGANRTQFTLTNARITTDNKMSWYDGNGLPSGNPVSQYLGWYLDLIDSGQPAQGERIVDELYIDGDRIEFISLIPSTDPCVGGGESWLFALNATTGSRFLTTSPWDYNLDGNYDSADQINWSSGQVWGSGINFKTPQRFRKTKLLTPGTQCQEINILNNSDGSIKTVSGNCTDQQFGRRSWRQIPID